MVNLFQSSGDLEETLSEDKILTQNNLSLKEAGDQVLFQKGPPYQMTVSENHK